MAQITTADIANAGVVGAGGAGFPTYVKLQAKPDTIVINAAECEPLLHKDKELLRHRTTEIVAGLAVAMELTGAKRAIFGIKYKYHDVIEVVKSALGAGMEVMTLPDAYPSGDEMTLVYETLGRVIPPGGLPIAVGVVVMNVETVWNVGRAATGQGPVVEKWLTVGGAVAHPITIRVPIGISLAECLAAAGGATIDKPYFVNGGPMMGPLVTDFANDVVDKTTGGLLVLPKESPVIRNLLRDWKAIARIGKSACDQCCICTQLCPRYLLGHPIEPHRAMRSLGFNLVGEPDVAGTQFCCECNLCSHFSCPEGLDPRNVCRHNKQKLISERKRWENPPFNPERPRLLKADRQVPTSRLIGRLGLRVYTNKGPLEDRLLTTDHVVIKLKQHVGAPCEPLVAMGDLVQIGQEIGRPPVKDGKPALGASVHASIHGRVAKIENGTIVITAE